MTTKRMSYALRKLQTQRFGRSLRGRFAQNQTTLAAARVTARTVQIGGQYYPGVIDGDSAAVVNVGRPASAIYGPATGGGAVVLRVGGGSASVVGAGGGGGLEPHNLNDTDIHLGQLDRTQALFVATDIAAGIATHAALPDVHHARVSSANSGITVNSSQVLTLALAASPGLEISSGLKLGTPSGSGAQTANQVSSATHTHAIAGYSDGALNPSELVKFDASGGIAPYYVTTPTINTASGNLTITPAGTGTFTPSAKALGSSVHTPGLLGQGWRISERDGIAGLSHLDIRSIYSDELIVKSFIADLVRVRMGEDWLTYSMGIVTANDSGVNFVVPAVGASARLYIEDSPFVTGELFADNEWVLLDILNRTGGGLVKAYIWGQVSSYQSESNNRQSWLFTNRSGTAGLTVDPGVPALSFGLSGQGYIHRSVVDPDSPFIRISTWSGANPYTPANRTVHVQLGNLDGVDWSPYFEPSGWGLYAGNAFLEGSLVAAAGNVWASTDGLNIQAGNSQGVYNDWPLHLTWAADPGAPDLAGQVFQIWGERYSDTNRGVIEALAGTGTGITSGRVIMRAKRVSESGGAVVDLIASDAGSTIDLNAIDPDGVTKGDITLNGNVTIGGDTDAIVSAPSIRPSSAGAKNLGTAGTPWGTLYVNNVVAETITGTTTLGGAIWQYDGDMIIRSVASAADRTLSVANPGTGLMHLDIEGSITVGGTVNGTDIASFHSDYLTHVANANAHHNQSHTLATTSALGGDHAVSGLTAGQVLRATGATTARFMQPDHGDLSGVTANQHHNQNHVLATATGLGPDHSVSGLTAGHVLRATSTAAARFTQLQHDDLGGVTANQHHNQVHSITGSDHTISGSQYQLVGAMAVNTLGLLTPSSNPGAAAAILRTGAGGDLTLKTLTVQGNVDITSGGDLTVGANVLFVDVSGTNVGINCAPDPQFDLDVAGNLRAQGWIVGKHAIQVDNATMIVHFDAGDGEKISAQGEPTGHLGQPATAAGNVLYGPGKFGGKALQVMESVTPVASYMFESGTDGFGILSSTTSVAQSSAHAIHGGGALRIEGAGAANGVVRSNFITVAGGTAYSASVYWRSDYDVQLVVTEYNSSNVLINTRTTGQITPDGWERQTLTWTTAAACAKIRIYLYHYNMPVGAYAYVDAVQLVQSAYSLPFTDQASHTRNYLDYSAPGVINPQHGTIMAWVKPDGISMSGQYVIATGIDGSSTRVYLYIDASGNWALSVGGASASSATAAVAQTWTHLALTWDGSTAVLYANGAAVKTQGYGGMVNVVASTLRIGANLSATNAFNGWIDEVAILDRAAPASEILAIYESDAPVFAETSVFLFRVGASLVWGDNEGLWTRDTDGTAAFAVSGVDGKSWGGVTLDKGDVMIGNSTHGYLQYDRSAGAMKIVDSDLTLYYGNGSRNKIKFINGSATIGEIHTYDFGSGAALGIWSYPADGDSASELFIGTKTLGGAINGYIAILDSTINMLGSVSFGAGNVTVQSGNQLQLNSAPFAAYGAWAHFRRSAGSAPTDPTATAFVKIDQDDASGAMATLEVRQRDDSEEFLYFNGNLGGPILTTALGSYAGKVRVSVAGLAGFYWIPFYN